MRMNVCDGETDARRFANECVVQPTSHRLHASKVGKVLRGASDGWTGKRPKLGYLHTHVVEAVERMKHGIREVVVVSTAPSSTLLQVAVAA